MFHFHPKVSIVIPVYNGSDYMRDAIDSALAQTYKNIEIIVINDGSNDDGKTHGIALSYGDKISYFKKENGGVASALNLGIEQMTGDYFSWLSHDDRYLPEKIEHQIEFVKNSCPGRVILFTDYFTINSKGKRTGTHKFDHQMFDQKPLYPLLRGCVHGCSLLVPREAFEAFGGFDIHLRTTQDYDLWYRMIRKYPFVHMQDVLVESRWHEKQGSKTLPEALIEGDQLWINMLDMCSEYERVAHEGSSYLFYLKSGKFLENTPYTNAKNHAFAKAEEFFKNIKVSVIVPCHNRVEWACEAIVSAQYQTFSNIEIIVVDDGSTENMDPVIAFANEDSRIRYFRREKAGASAARNFGMSNANGFYVAFLDSDDLFEKNKIEYQLRRMVEEDAPFSHTSYFIFGKVKDVLINSGRFKNRSLPELESLCTIATPTVMVRKDILKNNLRFPEEFEYGEDICFWISIAKTKCTFLGIDIPLTKVRRHTTNAALNKNKIQIGLKNVISFVESDPNFAKENAEQLGLLYYAIYYYSVFDSMSSLRRIRKLYIELQRELKILIKSKLRLIKESILLAK